MADEFPKSEPHSNLPGRERRGRIFSSSTLIWVVPAILFVVVIGLTILVWYLQRVDGQRDAQLDATLYGQRLVERGQGMMGAATRHLRREWITGHLADPDKFTSAVGNAKLIDPSLTMVGWVGSDGKCREICGSTTGLTQGALLSADGFWSSLMDRAKGDRLIACAGRIDPKDGPVIQGVLPGADGRTPGTASYVIFQFRVASMLQSLVEPSVNGVFVMDLLDNGEYFMTVPRSAPRTDASASIAPIDLPLRFLDRVWILHLTPTRLFVREHLASARSGAVGLAGRIDFACRKHRSVAPSTPGERIPVCPAPARAGSARRDVGGDPQQGGFFRRSVDASPRSHQPSFGDVDGFGGRSGGIGRCDSARRQLRVSSVGGRATVPVKRYHDRGTLHRNCARR